MMMFARRSMIALGMLAFLLHGVQLKCALSGRSSAADAFVSVAVSSGVPGGVVWEEPCNPIARPAIQITGDTLEASLNSIVKSDSRYRWVKHGIVVNLIPARGLPPFLKTRIQRFDSKGATNDTWAASLLLQLPEVRQAEQELRIGNNANQIQLGLMPGPPAGKQPPKLHELNIHLRNTTLFGALNSIVMVKGHGVWVFREWHCNGRNGFDISFSQ